ncbi:alpha/beta hydrolase [Synechocystis sp. PCC 7509]|uniref:alpha/beta hydrolase n=1 Tax=Synechocystis sp. PCC 7509 TaxID=927677 RepID=UPI0002AC2E1B|nr:alpha/beta hydrolase [Synechocystis sp. PCC 7509]
MSLLRRSLLLSIVIVFSLSNGSAFAAENVLLKYRIFRESISVKELTNFAQTGELSTSLRVNLALAKQDPKPIRQYLTETVAVNPILLDRVLNSPVGNVILDQISEAIHTPSRKADRQALRAALILSASRDRNISLIEVIQNYPTAEVEVEGEVLERAYRQLRQLGGNLQDLLLKIPF